MHAEKGNHTVEVDSKVTGNSLMVKLKTGQTNYHVKRMQNYKTIC